MKIILFDSRPFTIKAKRKDMARFPGWRENTRRRKRYIYRSRPWKMRIEINGSARRQGNYSVSFFRRGRIRVSKSCRYKRERHGIPRRMIYKAVDRGKWSRNYEPRYTLLQRMGHASRTCTQQCFFMASVIKESVARGTLILAGSAITLTVAGWH